MLGSRSSMSAIKPPIEAINGQNQADLLLRHVSSLFPERLAKAFLPKGAIIRSLGWKQSEFAARQRRLDRVLFIETEDQTKIVQHWEWESRPKPNLPFRIFEYNCLSALALHRGSQKIPSGEALPMLESIVVLLGGRKAPWPEFGVHRTSPEHLPFCGVQFRIIAVYQRSLNEIMAMGDAFWLIFAPLAVDASPEGMERTVALLKEQVDHEDFVELAAAMIALAQKDHRKRGLHKAIITAIQNKNQDKEIVMPHWFFQLGFERGKKEGKEEGIQQGRVAEARAVLKKVLSKRKLRLPRECKAEIDACSNLETLEMWLEKAVVAERVTQVFVRHS